MATVALAQWLPKWRGPGNPRPPLAWTPWLPLGTTVAWGLVAVGLLCHWRGRFWRYPLGTMWMGLAGSAGLAVALTAAQLLPVDRIHPADGPGRCEGLHDVYQFSLEPFRLIEAGLAQFSGNAI